MQIKETLLFHLKKLTTLTPGTSGNISVRDGDSVYVSPSGMSYESLSVDDIVTLDLEGKKIDGIRKPSSESTFHLDIYKKRDDVKAIVHTHSVHATTVACAGLEIPAIHYMIATIGKKVPLAQYETFGTKKLSDSICASLEDFNGLLIENHGVVTIGNNLEQAFARAEDIEVLAQMYLKLLQIQKMKILDEKEMDIVIEKFKTYGSQSQN